MAKDLFEILDPDAGKPGAYATVMRIDPKTGERSVEHPLSWGLVPHDTQDFARAPRPLWARAETIAEQPLFRDAFLRRRAIAPANEYFQKSSRQQEGTRFRLSRRDGEPIAMAALWEGYRLANGLILRTYCIITVEANAEVARIHDRMPLILEKDALGVWFGEEPGDFAALLRSPADGILDVRPFKSRR